MSKHLDDHSDSAATMIESRKTRKNREGKAKKRRNKQMKKAAQDVRLLSDILEISNLPGVPTRPLGRDKT